MKITKVMKVMEVRSRSAQAHTHTRTRAPVSPVTKLTGSPAPNNVTYEPDRLERQTVWEEKGLMKANFGSRLNTLRRAVGIMRRGIFFPLLLEFVVDMENTGERWESSSWRESGAQTPSQTT
jgi:hypothetical protein